MKYFAKYLPVEGEIKEDDFIYEKSLSDQTIHQVYLRNNELVFYRFRNVPIKLSKAEKAKKVKLFLCSRDIPKGEKVALCDETCGSFIKIGEISPEASWVKEGDKFEEYSTALLHNVEGEWKIYDGIRWSAYPNQKFISVKGPCGHFH